MNHYTRIKVSCRQLILFHITLYKTTNLVKNHNPPQIAKKIQSYNHLTFTPSLNQHLPYQTNDQNKHLLLIPQFWILKSKSLPATHPKNLKCEQNVSPIKESINTQLKPKPDFQHKSTSHSQLIITRRNLIHTKQSLSSTSRIINIKINLINKYILKVT